MISALFLFVGSVYANNTVSVEFQARNDSPFPSITQLVVVDDVGTVDSARIVSRIDRVGSIPVRRGPCESGELVLTSLRHDDQVRYIATTQTLEHTISTNDFSYSDDIVVEERVPATQANLSVESFAEWSVRTCDGEVLDTRQLRSRYGDMSVGPDAETAAAGLDYSGSEKRVVKALDGWFSPRSSMRSQRIFDGGSRELAEGARLARDQDWETAARIWAKLANQSARMQKERVVQARAVFNLAVFEEFRGNTERARELAEDAHDVLHTSMTLQFLAHLDEPVKVDDGTGYGYQL